MPPNAPRLPVWRRTPPGRSTRSRTSAQGRLFLGSHRREFAAIRAVLFQQPHRRGLHQRAERSAKETNLRGLLEQRRIVGGTALRDGLQKNNSWSWFQDNIDGGWFVDHDPPLTPGTVSWQPDYVNHPILKGLPSPWNTSDEWYLMNRNVEAVAGFRVLAKVSVSASSKGTVPRPAVWIRDEHERQGRPILLHDQGAQRERIRGAAVPRTHVTRNSLVRSPTAGRKLRMTIQIDAGARIRRVGCARELPRSGLRLRRSGRAPGRRALGNLHHRGSRYRKCREACRAGAEEY